MGTDEFKSELIKKMSSVNIACSLMTLENTTNLQEFKFTKNLPERIILKMLY